MDRSRWPSICSIAALLLAGSCAAPDSAPAAETSVKPGINANFLDPELDVREYVDRFASESREIFVHRARIAAALGLREGMRVADIGAGTGVFTFMFAARVGASGHVAAVDLSPRFLDLLRETVADKNVGNVSVVACTERDVCLPDESVDVAFVCDTYHHFEYPQPTLASIHRALRPGGELWVVDFHRIPGVTREWLLGHVRAGQDVFRAEIEAAGFTDLGDVPTPFLTENYMMHFRRR